MTVKRHQDQLDDLGRFSEPALLVLVSLADGPKHGYAMTQDIFVVSGQKMGPGTLWRDHAARVQGLDRAAANRRPAAAVPAHGHGQRVLKHRLDSLRAVARIGQARLANG